MEPAYPLYGKRREQLLLRSGRPVESLNLENLRAGEAGAGDLGTRPETLLAQADLAELAGFLQVAANFRRAAELTGVPDEKILEIYNALRPGRSSPGRIEALACELEEAHRAPLNAAFLREAIRSGAGGRGAGGG